MYGSSGRHAHEAELRCIELATGKICWSHRGLYRCSLLYVDGHFVCLSEAGEHVEAGALLLLRATSERLDIVARAKPKDQDSRPLIEYPAWAAPVLSHGLLYVRGKDRLVCLDLMPADSSKVTRLPSTEKQPTR